VQPTIADIELANRLRWGEPERRAWGPKLWQRIGYHTPDDYYEGLVIRALRESKSWLDVGCGRFIFPNNHRLAEHLVRQCELVVGVDPDDTVAENTYVHEKIQSNIEQLNLNRRFDLVTLRMVAEHIATPQTAVASLARLTKAGGTVIIYTINRWSPVSLFTWLLPFRFHHSIKRLLWRTEEKDTFPVTYKMNTRAELGRLFKAAGFRESHFAYVADCRLFFRFGLLHKCELAAWTFCKAVGVPYPENCIVAAYTRV
jgi:2-polyprenyl-3-methyl-5-hydroxy-6-metoxy-1,4-benzoquinol methylase